MVDFVGNRTLPDLLAERTEAYGEKPYLIFESAADEVTSYSYEEFQRLVYKTANAFAALGVSKGDAVTLMLPNCPEFLLCWFGLAHIGAVAVPANTANTGSEMGHVIEHSESVALVTDSRLLRRAQEGIAVAGSEHAHVIVARASADAADDGVRRFNEFVEVGSLDRPAVDIDSEDPLQMIFTSGTTARPKGVVLTHANVLRSGERVAKSVTLEVTDRCLTALPVFHVNAQSVTVMSSLSVGGTCVLLEEYSAAKFWSQIQAHHATQTSLVAMQVRTLLAQEPAETDSQHDLRRVFYAINVTDAEKEEFERRFAVDLINGYGLSEAMTIVTVAPVFGPRRWPSIGLPAFDRDVRIVDSEGKEVPPNTVGELIVQGVRGRTLMKEYFKNPKATSEALRGDWLYTGDNAYMDEDGYVYFFDRKKDVIKRAGENVSASEVEAALIDHPDVAEAAVIGIPDEIRDEAVKAYVVLREGSGLTPEDITDYCKGKLAYFKVPTVVEIRKDLPKTSVGKIEKKLLRQEEASAQGPRP